MIEFHAGGGFMNSWNFRTFKADLYLTGVDYFRLALEILFLLGLVLWTSYTVWQIKTHPKRHQGDSYFSWFWSPWWNATHVISLLVIKPNASPLDLCHHYNILYRLHLPFGFFPFGNHKSESRIRFHGNGRPWL